MSRKFGPLDGKDAHLLRERCPGCGKQFRKGDYVALVPIGPGNDPEARERCRDMRPYNAVSLPAHWACVTGEVGYDLTDATPNPDATRLKQ